MIFSANLVTWVIFWTKMFFKKYYVLPIMPIFIGEEYVSNVSELKLLCLTRPVFRNKLVSFHEIWGDPLETTASNRQVCLWYNFLLNGDAEADLQKSSELLQEKRKHFRSSHPEALQQKGVLQNAVLHCSYVLAVKNYEKYLWKSWILVKFKDFNHRFITALL